MSKDNKPKTDKNKRPIRSSSKLIKCEGCNSKLTSTSQALECDGCNDTWSCISCLNMNPDLYELLESDEHMKWNCSKCLKLRKKSEEKGNDELKDILKAMSQQLNRMEIALQAKVDRAEHEELEARVSMLEEQDPVDARKIDKMIEEKVAQQIDAYREREARKLNLIIHNMKEPEAETPHERKDLDLKEMENLLESLECDDTEVVDVQRLGQKQENKPRLILLKTKKVAQKRKILMSAKKLRESEEEDKKKIFITPDMSKEMREQNRKLRQELRERREAGEGDLVIRQGKIVPRDLITSSTFRNTENSETVP